MAKLREKTENAWRSTALEAGKQGENIIHAYMHMGKGEFSYHSFMVLVVQVFY